MDGNIQGGSLGLTSVGKTISGRRIDQTAVGHALNRALHSKGRALPASSQSLDCMTLAGAGPPPQLLSSHRQAHHAPRPLLRPASPPHAGARMLHVPCLWSGSRCAEAYSLVRMQAGMCMLNKARLSPREGCG
jgi:hypothetical protein